MATVLVTGASGQIGSFLCARLRASGHDVLATDVQENRAQGITGCDIRHPDQIRSLFESNTIRKVIHLAAVLPTAFRADPLVGAEVNLAGTLALLREAVVRRVERLVFSSSMSVYGSSDSPRPLSENDLATPDDPYGAAKRAVELIGERLGTTATLDFVALRIARVLGPGARRTASSWRSDMFDGSLATDQLPIHLPFAPTARLALTHASEVARMLMLLTETAEVPRSTYNSPAEVLETQDLGALIEQARGLPVSMGEGHGGPIPNGRLFAEDFGFRLKGLADYLPTMRTHRARP